jgi:hypothetical protein
MWRTLLSSGVLLAPVKARIQATVRHAVTVAVAAVLCLLFVIVGLFCLAAAAVAILTPIFGIAAAAAIIGGVAILLGLIVLLIGTLSNGGGGRKATRAPSIEDAAAQVERAVKASPLPWLLGAALVGMLFGRRL